MIKLTPIIQTAAENVKAAVTHLSSEGAVDTFRVSLTFPENTVPTPVTVNWSEEFLNILHIWYPSCRRCLEIHQWFGARKADSNFCSGAPILTAIGPNGFNTATVSVSDTSTPICISLGALNSTRGQNLADYKVTFFTRPCKPVTEYTADIRIDRRHVPFHEAVMSVYPWWKSTGIEIPACPPAAEDALYSTWYSCYQNPVGKDILEDLKVASEAGFRTVILDDGWQFDGPEGNGYGKCGDWKIAKTKFPDFKAFTDGVHNLGMKLILWFSVPFIGYEADLYKKFENKLLSKNDGLSCAVLDVRYPDVREYLKDTYKSFVREYDIDGFKLDFIDSFRPGELAAPYSEESGMDCPFVEDAVKLLLKEITEELAEIKPDLLYEYRQNYIGPAVNSFGNMLRVGDCAYDSLTNRIGMVNLRLMGYPIAIHSDMLCWSTEEDPKVCAKQLLNVLFCVPQISVFLADIPEAQKKLLKHYLDYWTANRHILLHGEFRALNPEYYYTYVSAENDDKLIAVIYNDTTFTYTGKPADVHLNGNRDGLMFENLTDKAVKTEIHNCFGELLETAEIPAGAIVRLPVPETGMVRCL